MNNTFSHFLASIGLNYSYLRRSIMGGAVSSGESNDDLIDNLLEADYIKSPLVERVFRAVDRAFYYTEPYKQNAYKDLAWKDGNLHLSAPCIYSEVLENLDLQPGMCFLNVGSGTGYFSTMCGLILGKTGVNHGIELYPDVVNYARMKLDEFQRMSPAVDEFEFCPPEFTTGNCLDATLTSKRYDRIYCGAAATNEYVASLIEMLKIGGVCVVPVGDSLIQITRIEDKKDERKILLPVSFATLISPRESAPRVPVELPDWGPKKLTDLCRSEIRIAMRQTISLPEPKILADENRKKKKKRRQERRRASRLVVVQRRRSGSDVDGENGFVAIAYSMGGNSSDDDRNHGGNLVSAPNQDEIASNANSNESSNEAATNQDDDDIDMIVEAAEESLQSVEDPVVEVGSSENNVNSGEPSSSSSVAENGATSSRSDVAVVSGTCSFYSVATNNGRKFPSENGTRRDATARRPERRSASATVPARGRSTVAAPRSARTGRSYRAGAESLLGRIRELVRARQHDLESMRRQFQRNSSDADHSRSRSTSGREDNNTDDNAESSPNEPEEVENVPMDSEASSSDSSPSSASSSSSEDEATESRNDGTKKRCRNEMSDEKATKNDPKPDPLLVNPCSVQMRQKIIALPLPPALKVYLNYDRKLYY